jgi:hypothetical protein
MYFTLTENNIIHRYSESAEDLIQKTLKVPKKIIENYYSVEDFPYTIHNSDEKIYKDQLLNLINGHTHKTFAGVFTIRPVDPRYIQITENEEIVLLGEGRGKLIKDIEVFIEATTTKMMDSGIVVNYRKYSSSLNDKIQLTTVIKDVDIGKIEGLDFAFYDIINKKVDMIWHTKEMFDEIYLKFFENEKILTHYAISIIQTIKSYTKVNEIENEIENFISYTYNYMQKQLEVPEEQFDNK